MVTYSVHKRIYKDVDVRDDNEYYLELFFRPTSKKHEKKGLIENTTYGGPYKIGFKYFQPKIGKFVLMRVKEFKVSNGQGDLLFDFSNMGMKVESMFESEKPAIYLCDEAFKPEDSRFHIVISVELVDNLGKVEERKYEFRTKINIKKEPMLFYFN